MCMDTKRGRPPKPDGESADQVLQLRLTAAEKAAWREAAERAGLSISAWIKDRLGKASAKEGR